MLTEHVKEFPVFYAMRPEWLDGDEQRQAFANQFPELVEEFHDCGWQPESQPEAVEAAA